jgi:hypothetical protein
MLPETFPFLVSTQSPLFVTFDRAGLLRVRSPTTLPRIIELTTRAAFCLKRTAILVSRTKGRLIAQDDRLPIVGWRVK